MDDVGKKVRAFLAEELLVDVQNVPDHEHLFASGLIDSFGFVQMIAYLEGEFGVQFAAEELLAGRLISIAAICDAVIERAGNRVG